MTGESVDLGAFKFPDDDNDADEGSPCAVLIGCGGGRLGTADIVPTDYR